MKNEVVHDVELLVNAKLCKSFLGVFGGIWKPFICRQFSPDLLVPIAVDDVSNHRLAAKDVRYDVVSLPGR